MHTNSGNPFIPIHVPLQRTTPPTCVYIYIYMYVCTYVRVYVYMYVCHTYPKKKQFLHMSQQRETIHTRPFVLLKNLPACKHMHICMYTCAYLSKERNLYTYQKGTHARNPI